MELLPLRSGPVSLQFDARLGSLRYLRIGNEEILRHVYAAVRDENWTTIPARIDVETVTSTQAEFSIRLRGICDAPPVGYRWTLDLAGNASGEIQIRFHGVAESAFLRNRIGLCLLHPISGGQFERKASDGTGRMVAFPSERVSPWQPATDIAEMRWMTAGGVAVEIQFGGELFEMEDQRNWGDHSLKTYATPQHLPKPVLVHPGEEVHQCMQIRMRAPSAGTWEPAGPVAAFPLAAVPKPRLGLLAGPADGLRLPGVRDRLAELRLDHIRVDLRLQERGWKETFHAAAECAAALPTNLHAALFVSGDAARELAEVAAITAGSSADVFLVYRNGAPLTPVSLLELARETLGEDAVLAGGSDGLFCEINRNPPPGDAFWLPCFSAMPQAHLTDEETMVENLPAIADALRTLQNRHSQPVLISPISLGPRIPADPRQETSFGAAWLLGCLRWLCASANLRSATLFPTHGPGGVLTASGAPNPPWEVMRFLADAEMLTPWQVADSLNVSAVSACGKVCVANHGRTALEWFGHRLAPQQVGVFDSPAR